MKIEASDILAEIDEAILGMGKENKLNPMNRDNQFTIGIFLGLKSLRSYLRSEEFVKKVSKLRKRGLAR